MSDHTHRRRPISRILLMVLLVSLVLPFASLRSQASLAASPRQAATSPAQTNPSEIPTSVTIAGSLQSEAGCPTDWEPACANTHLTFDANDDVWQGTFSLPAGDYAYKAALNNNWTENYGANATRDGTNIGLNLGAARPVKFFYDHKTHWATDNKNSVIATVAGSFQSELGCATDWSPDCLRSWLQDPDGDGIYAFETTTIPAGSYEAKVAINEDWAENYGVGGTPGGANITFVVPAPNTRVAFRYNPISHVLVISAGHGRDNNVEYVGLGHDSRSDVYRTPFGAVPVNTPVTLRFRTFSNDVTDVKARLYNTATNAQSFQTMALAATNVGCYDTTTLATERCDFWTTTITPTQRGVLYYRFIITDGTATAYYEDDNRLDGGWGEAVPTTADRSYNIYVYEPDFTTPEWTKNAVIYQIFVERFRNGDETNDPTADPSTDRGWFYPDERGRRFPIKPWNTIVPDPEPYSDPSREYWATYSSTMYGGDLQGVQQKLDYLQSMGVTTLYLNPIFDSPSNHKYDGRDYRTVDPAFGGEAAFASLATAAHARSMKIVLDGVPNHVSSDSPFFDRFGRHAEVGACESQNSPYRAWFFFEDVEPGTGKCVSSSGVANAANYRGWFGVPTLPQINTANPQVMAYWFGTPGGNPSLPTNTASYWVTGNDKADGWRIDVVPDVVGVNPTFFETWRSTMKAANPNAVLYSETWPESDVRDRVLGDEFDSTMNYRYRKALLGFLRDTRWTDNDGGQEVDPLSPSQFVNAFKTMEEDYPKPAFDAAMNLLGSHDTNRPVHVLNEKGFTGTGYNRQPVDGFADARERLSMVAVLQMTLPGAPTIYYGDEVGLTGYGYDVARDDPYNRQPYPWADEAGYNTLPEWRKSQTNLLSHYQALGTLRGQYSFLRTGSFDPLLTDDANKMLAYGRKDATGAGIVVMNRDTVAHTATLNLNSYIPTGTVLSQTLPLGGGLSSPGSGSTYTFTVPANSYGIWLTPSGTNMTPPAAPANLTVTAELSQTVTLSWSSVAGATGYNIYRSPLSGGGFELVGNSSSPTFSDTGLVPGKTYYYIVKAVQNGLESAASNEVVAVPHHTINWANLQWPPSINHTISTITPTQTIYGQVYIENVTLAVGATDNLLAEVGYGPDGSNPASGGWTWTRATFNNNAGNNDEFQATLLPTTTGTFDYAYRYSTTNGRDWIYADLDGIGNGYSPDQAGNLVVVASSDTTAPAAPLNLREVSRSATQIGLAWTAPADTDIDHYEVWRDSTLLAMVDAPTTSYTDFNVTSGISYTYKVKAVDTSFNRSPFSNSVTVVAEQREVTVTFRVRVPEETPANDVVYIAGNNADVFNAQWNPSAQPMTEVAPNIWEWTTTALEGTELQYKYTRGAWDRVEWWGTILGLSNRSVTISYGTNGVYVVDNTAVDWGSGNDSDKAVQSWRDPLVASISPANAAFNTTGPISVTWSRPVTATAALSSVLTLRNSNGTIIPGTVTASGNATFIFTPAAPLPDGVYTVTANNVKRTDINEPVPMQAPFVWSFRVGPFKIYLPIVMRG